MRTARDIANRDLPVRPPTVLIVEDELLVRMVIADYLRDCGFRVIESSTADEATRVFETDEHIDIVFSDVQIPGSLDGFGLAQWLRRERPGVKIILTSGVPRAASAASELCEDGPLMNKPYKPDEVERRIRSLLAHYSASRPE
jgi:DNA-binding response OmpR family regulator